MSMNGKTENFEAEAFLREEEMEAIKAQFLSFP